MTTQKINNIIGKLGNFNFKLVSDENSIKNLKIFNSFEYESGKLTESPENYKFSAPNGLNQ